MAEVEKLCKKILSTITLGRIKQITRGKCSSRGGGLEPPQPFPGSASADIEPRTLEDLTEKVCVLFFPNGKNSFAGRLE